MTVAKGAVPVWIMPLNEVAETFDPRTARFDVVIIDEASQCDPTAMFALYLGRQTVIVGDDEQVTPVAVGVEMEQVQKLIQVHLQGYSRTRSCTTAKPPFMSSPKLRLAALFVLLNTSAVPRISSHSATRFLTKAKSNRSGRLQPSHCSACTALPG